LPSDFTLDNKSRVDV